MSATDWATYWWSHLTGPCAIVEEILSQVSEGRSIFLRVPEDLPWRHEMRSLIQEKLRISTALSNLQISELDILEIDNAIARDNPGMLLLDKYALRDVRDSYRARMKDDLQDYILANRVLKNRLIWVKGLDSSALRSWHDFCSGYKGASLLDGLFVIEGTDGRSMNWGQCRIVDYQSKVTSYDSRTLAAIIAGSPEIVGLSDEWRCYLAACASHMCGLDAEVIAAFLFEGDIAANEPTTTLKSIANEPRFSKRGARGRRHALAKAREDDPKLKKLLWEAQLEILFPLIEGERSFIVDLLLPQLEKIVEEGIRQYEESVHDARELELGTLVYLIASKKLQLIDPVICNRIHFLRSCRNKLAHSNTLSCSEVKELLDSHRRFVADMP